ncbi:hypothetical protein HHX47_DHR8000491 [Lentinula edodes]|nr:hypothetical protein HHX47_DHR8000491 [Lentinula edodes]
MSSGTNLWPTPEKLRMPPSFPSYRKFLCGYSKK